VMRAGAPAAARATVGFTYTGGHEDLHAHR
jgi:hypothetical protein